MKVCIISKYPPIQGGVSAKTYWLARGFAEAGHEIHVVTNGNCVEKEYFIDDNPDELIPNLAVHFVTPDIPWHIPDSKLYTSRLLDKALEITENHQIDIIDTNYLVPYGIVGYLLSNITGIPYILRHGGSDLAKFLHKGLFSHLLGSVVQNAAAIITDDKNRGVFEATNSNVYVLPRYIPDEKYFKSTMISHEVPTFAYIGKINHYWKYKSLDKIVDIFSGIKEEHTLHLVGQGKGFREFAKFVEAHGIRTHEFRKFVHPVNMPYLLGHIDYLLYFSQDNPIKDFSNIVCEAVWSGVPVITDGQMDIKEYTQYTKVVSENQFVRLELGDMKAAQEKIAAIINEWSGPSRYTNEIDYGYDRYVEANLKTYDRV